MSFVGTQDHRSALRHVGQGAQGLGKRWDFSRSQSHLDKPGAGVRW